MSTDTDTRPLFLRRRYPRADGTNGHRTALVSVAPADAKPYARKALAEEVATLASTIEGRRNHQLNIAGFNLSQLVAGGYLNHDEAWNALHTTALAIGLTERETLNTLRSSFAAGTANPRTVQQMAEQEQLPTVTTMRPISPDDIEELTEGEDEPPSIRDRFKALDWHELWDDDSEEEWIVYPLLPARRLVALFSPPKVGKSLLMLEVAVGIARGTTVLGTRVEQRRVLYVDFENDPRGDVRTRLQAMGCTPDQLDDLVYLSYPRLAYLDTTLGGLELLAVAQEYGVDVVVIDTISRAVNGEENDNDTWLAFYRHTGLALKAAGIAVIRLDHTGKDATKGMRGGSAKYGDVDAVWSLARVTETTFRLECTDNRLPIGEKLLLVERHADPLRHDVTTRSTGDVIRDEATRFAHELDRRGVSVKAGSPTVRKELTLLGFSVEERMARAIAKLRQAEHYIPAAPLLTLVQGEGE